MAECPKFPLVWIEWEDSARADGAWRFIEDWTDAANEIVCCVTVGFLINDGDKVKAVAQNIGDADTSAVQASGVIRIPLRSVTRMKVLSSPS